MARPKKAKCPECSETFELEDNLEAADMTYCTECMAELRVVSLDPIRLEIAFEQEDDEEIETGSPDRGDEFNYEKGF